MYRSALGACVAIAVGSLLFVAGPAWSTNAPIYKCFDKNLGLLYTDLPCKDGEQLDLRPGDADPASVARLERERDQLDQSVAQRILDERRAAAQRDLADRIRGEAVYGDGVPNYPDYSLAYGYGYPFVTYPPHAHPRPHRPHPLPRIADQHRFAPNPPYMVPRQ
jgi:hypothetical protein